MSGRKSSAPRPSKGSHLSVTSSPRPSFAPHRIPSAQTAHQTPSLARTACGEGFFHDLRTFRPLRVRLGVCGLPDEAESAAPTPLLLPPRKFLTLPEEKGGADVMGWAAAFPTVSVELPREGIYNKAAVSVTVMLPP